MCSVGARSLPAHAAARPCAAALCTCCSGAVSCLHVLQRHGHVHACMCCAVGSVIQVGQDFIGLLVLGVINASIAKSSMRSDLAWDTQVRWQPGAVHLLDLRVHVYRTVLCTARVPHCTVYCTCTALYCVGDISVPWDTRVHS